MKTPKYTRTQAKCLIPLLEGITEELADRRARIQVLEDMVASLAQSAHIHGEDLRTRRYELHHERLELRRVGTELEEIGCTIALTEPFEIFIPGEEESFGWRPGDSFLRRSSLEPFAA